MLFAKVFVDMIHVERSVGMCPYRHNCTGEINVEFFFDIDCAPQYGTASRADEQLTSVRMQQEIRDVQPDSRISLGCRGHSRFEGCPDGPDICRDPGVIRVVREAPPHTNS